MLKLQRSGDNPVLQPSSQSWEKIAAFNGSCIRHDETYHIVYRAISEKQEIHGEQLEVSTIGHAVSSDGIHFTDHTQLIKPDEEWEKFGCEDPRVTKLDDKFYIFYTALSTYPFSAPGIRCAVAVTRDFKTIDEKHLVTPFNAKAMTMFPERINGKIAVILTAHTDMPPAKISIAYFDDPSEMWSESYWKNWYKYLDDHALSLQRNDKDHVEIGATPIKTDEGWLLIYSYIKDYFTDNKIFTIEALLLDHDDPRKILGRTRNPMLIPEREYELYGFVPNIVFPSGGLIKDDELYVYYGGADTVTCVATCKLADMMREVTPAHGTQHLIPGRDEELQLERFSENPILSPIPSHKWESKAVFNPAAVYEEGKVYIVYRAMGDDNTSVMGLAISKDGLHIDERLSEPIYVPREPFEKADHGGNSGCEDPRLVRVDDTFHMCYTAYDGHNPPRVALSSIKVNDFLNRKWDTWTKPKLISPPGVDDKDATVMPKKFDGQYMFFHRFVPNIWVDFVDDLEFKDKFLKGQVLLEPRPNRWDQDKIGIAGPPVETEQGWLLLYHGINNGAYKTGAVLLAHNNPMHILAGTNEAILEPQLKWEKEGIIPNVVFPIGNVIIGDTLFVYYGGADTVTGVATANINKFLGALLRKS